MAKVSWKMLVLEAWIVTFGVKRSFWKLGSSLLVKVSWKMLVLEAWIVTFGVKRSFWKLGSSLVVKVSWKMLVLEAWIVTFGESLVTNACFGSLDCHFWFLVSRKMLVLEAWIVTLVLEACLVCKSVLTREASKSVKQECPARV